MRDRYASIYASPMPGFRVGPSSPVTFFRREGVFKALVRREDPNGRVSYDHRARPRSYDTVLTVEAGQYGSGYASVIC